MRTKEELMERAYKSDEIKHIDCSQEEMFVVVKGVDVDYLKQLKCLSKKLVQTNFRFQKIGVA